MSPIDMPASRPDLKVRVRFAPSPTGYLHIGGARTALFNYLYARRHGGVFILRIEDTDRERSTPEAVRAILDGLRYLGLDWDEGPEAGGAHGPYFQAQRGDLHRATVERLIERGKAYHCFCSKERLAELRAAQEARKERLHYDRRCAGIDRDDARRRLRAGESAVVRFKVEDGETVIEDMIRGTVRIQHAEIEDFVILRPDGTTVYNLAVVADDHGMEVTHVIRGEDHLTNTPKQILLFEALGLPPPRYGHIPLILGPGGAKLSKRHGAVSVTEYREKGYLPEAMVNFLVRMGWSYDDRQEIFSMSDLIEKFSLEGISKSGAVYDLKKLDHLGGHYLRQRPLGDVVELALPHLVQAGFVSPADTATSSAARPRLERMIELERPRISCVSEVVERLRYYFREPVELDKGALKALRKRADGAALVARYAADLERSFAGGWGHADHGRLEEHARGFLAREGAELSELAQALRALLTGRSATPGLFEVMAVLGKETALGRLRGADAWFAKAREES
jgi:glutamyl-tRNA synthetase